MVDITAIKRNRQIQNDMLKANIAAELAPKTYEDNRFWKPEMDKLGNASAVIRFLYTTDGDTSPYVKYTSYSFKGPTGKYYIEKCLKSIEKSDPVYEMNGRLYNSNNETNKLIAKNQRLNTNYISNILVINDPKHPENNGKVFLYRYGPQIYKMITSKIAPEFEDIPSVPVFDYWEGANFRLRLKNSDAKAGEKSIPTYANSSWDNPSPIGPDEYIQKIAEQQYPLAEFLTEKHFKTYEELKKRLDFVYDQDSNYIGRASDHINIEKPKEYVNKSPSMSEPMSAPSDEEDYEEYFNNLLEEG